MNIKKNNVKNICLSKFNLYTGFLEPHIPAPYLKSSFEIIWDKFNDELHNACLDKFRSSHNSTENLIRYYQMTTGKFVPINREKHGMYLTMSSKKLPSVIREQKTNI